MPRLISLDSFACCLRHTTCRCLVTHAYTIFESLHPNHACLELDLTSWSRSQSNTRRISSPPPRQVVSTHCLRRHARHLRPKYAHNFYKRLTIWHVPNSLARPHNHNSRYTARQPEQIANQLTLRIGVSCFRRSSQAAVIIVVQRKFRVDAKSSRFVAANIDWIAIKGVFVLYYSTHSIESCQFSLPNSSHILTHTQRRSC